MTTSTQAAAIVLSTATKNVEKKKGTVMSEFEKDYDEIKNEASGIISSLSSNDAIIPLTLSISSYLMPRDVLNCIQTCKLWNDKFNKSAVWCEVAKAVSFTFRRRGDPGSSQCKR